ncbi:MAG: hypothetical protein R2780_14055 [Crocinitomicaceae bacterium]
MSKTKGYISYDKGFLNYTAEAYYLTISGNWSEIDKLEEKTKSTYRKNKMRIVRHQFFIAVFTITTCSLLFISFPGIIALPIALIAAPLLISFLIKALRTEFGNLIKIPTRKIKKLVTNDNSLIIHYFNGEDESDMIKLSGINKKDLQEVMSFSNELNLINSI